MSEFEYILLMIGGSVLFWAVKFTFLRIKKYKEDKIIHLEKSKTIDISTTEKFKSLIFINIKPTISNSKYESHCWRCKKEINSQNNLRCPICGWYICSCGKCKPNCKRNGDYGYLLECSDAYLESIRNIVINSNILNKYDYDYNRIREMFTFVASNTSVLECKANLYRNKLNLEQKKREKEYEIWLEEHKEEIKEKELENKRIKELEEFNKKRIVYLVMPVDQQIKKMGNLMVDCILINSKEFSVTNIEYIRRKSSYEYEKNTNYQWYQEIWIHNEGYNISYNDIIYFSCKTSDRDLLNSISGKYLVRSFGPGQIGLRKLDNLSIISKYTPIPVEQKHTSFRDYVMEKQMEDALGI